MKNYYFPYTVECLEEGGYYAECPILQGCHVEGETYAEVIENLDDAIRIFLASYKELGRQIPNVPIVKQSTIVSSGIPIPVGRK